MKSGKTDAFLMNNAVSQLAIHKNPELTYLEEWLGYREQDRDTHRPAVQVVGGDSERGGYAVSELLHLKK